MLSVGFLIILYTQVKVITDKCIVGRGMMPYDLLWPVNTRIDAVVPEAKVMEEVAGMLKNGSSMSCDGGTPRFRISTDVILFSGLTYFSG